METWNFLGTINGIYNLDNNAQEYNIISTLLVYTNEYKETLKIEYIEIEYRQKYVEEPTKVKKGEIILKGTSQMESELIVSNFNNSLIKKLIFNKYLDYFGAYLIYQKIC